eukprot:jgi/Psemu1/34364/gm1.34364_g
MATNIPVPAAGGNEYSEDMRRHTIYGNDQIRGAKLDKVDTLPCSRTAQRYKKGVRELRRNKICPKATRYECIPFLWRLYGCTLPTPIVHSPKDITQAEDVIGISQKKASTMANQAILLRNLLKQQRYWAMDYPHRTANISRDDLINNVNEAGIKLNHANWKMGKCALCRRV